jgi:hypothetical protein
MALRTEDPEPGTRGPAVSGPGSGERTPRGVFGVPSERLAAIVFAVIEVLAVPILMSWGRGQTFIGDDFDFLAFRRVTSLHDLFAAHVDHWVTLPVLVYRFLWWAVGMRSYVPYQLLVVGLHLTAAALLRVVMRRAGVNAWIATIAATVFVFFGAGVENIVVAFQITFVGSLVFGLVELLLADHDGGLERRDWLALGAGLLSLLCSGIGVIFVGVTALTALLRRGWRMALFQSAPLGVVYAVWYESIGRRTSIKLFHASTWGQRAAFVRTGIAATFDALGGIPAGGYLVAAMLIAGLAVLVSTSGWKVFRGRAAAPISLLAGGVGMLLVTAVGRAGAPEPTISALVALQGSNHARQSRILHLGAAMTIPALALAADAIIRRKKALAVVVLAVLVIGMPSNLVDHKIPPFAAKSGAQVERYRLESHLAILKRFPRKLELAPYLTVGWLLDGAESGRIPGPTGVKPVELANTTMYLAINPYVKQTEQSPCEAVPVATHLIANNGLISVKGAPFGLSVVLDDGTRSFPLRLPQGQTFGIRGGPLDIILDPIGGTNPQVCGAVNTAS